VLIDCSGPDDELKNEDTAFVRKRDSLLQLMARNNQERVLVFCNSIPACRKVKQLFKPGLLHRS